MQDPADPPSREHELLCELSYQSWLDRGRPVGSPEVDWDFAKAHIGTHAPVANVGLEK